MLRLGRAALGGVASLGEAPDLVAGRGRATLDGVDLPVQPGQAFPLVGRRAQQPGDAALLGGVGGLGLVAAGRRLLEPGGRLRHRSGHAPELFPDASGLGFELLGITAEAPLFVGLDGGEPDALGGQAGGAAQSFAEPGESVPGLLGGGEPRRVGTEVVLELGLGVPCLGDRLLDRGASLLERVLVGELLIDDRSRCDDVVGEQSRARVAGVRLDDGGTASDLGLPAQRLQLAAELGENVLQAGEIALRGVELAQRLLLALAVLEDAGRLLDEAAAFLRRRAQHGVELTLPDDDVHLAADAGVAEQLLDVEQTALGAVDGVLRATVAEHRARDRDLAVLDRQSTVGVVDGEHDLGPAERGPAGGAGEDDVLHLAAAQRLRPLLAHDPRQRVDDVGLARPVRARRHR